MTAGHNAETTEFDATTTALASFAADFTQSDLTNELSAAATRRILDTLGCAIGGADSPPAHIARGLAGDVPVARGSHVLGLSSLSTPEMAAFANAVMARYLDYNDMNKSLRGGGHPSDMIAAVLAVADANHLSGRDTIRGITVAYQGFGSIPVHIKKQGWDQGVFITVGVAMGVGSMLGLSRRQISHAISLALTPNIPLCSTRRGALSMWKGCASASADRNAIFAVSLATKGMTGPSKPFEGTHGLWDQATGPFSLELDPAEHGYRITHSDIKKFPADGTSQAILDTLLDMTSSLRFDDVAEIEVQTHWDAWFETGSEAEKWDPRSRETADHSMPYLMARAIYDRGITLDSFDDDAIRDPAIRPLMKRITFSENPELTALRPAQTLSDIIITTSSGEKLSSRTKIPRGDHRNPMTDDELERKFLDMAERRASSASCRRLVDEIWALDRTPDTHSLMEAWASIAAGPQSLS